MAEGKKTGGRKAGVPNKATRELKEIAQQYTTEAIHTLLDIMERGQTEAARVAAAREVLDRGYGRSVGSGTQVNVSAAGGQLDIVCTEEERQRLIAQRERLLSASKTPLQAHQLSTDTPKPTDDRWVGANTPKADATNLVTLWEALDDELSISNPQWEPESE